MKIGVILPQEYVPAALAAGVDYVEPVISGNIVTPSGSGWVAGPAALTQRRDPSFAILFPPTLRLSDPGFESNLALVPDLGIGVTVVMPLPP